MSGTPRLSARELIGLVADPRSWQSWDIPPDEPTADPRYRAELRRARQASGVDEAILTRLGQDRRASGGSRRPGIRVPRRLRGGRRRRLMAAIERATRQRLPLLAATASGGTRIQEGRPAFVQMANITRAIVGHGSAGLPYLVYLCDPTVGGVFASRGSLGHVTFAEPGALLGFIGPGVARP